MRAPAPMAPIRGTKFPSSRKNSAVVTYVAVNETQEFIKTRLKRKLTIRRRKHTVRMRNSGIRKSFASIGY